MPSQDPRTEVRVLQDEIDQLNHKKGPLKAEWDKLSDGKGTFFHLNALRNPPEALTQLKEINARLTFLYGQRNALLKEYPALQREFGTPVSDAPKRLRATDRLETKAAQTAADRHKRKAMMHPEFKTWCATQKPQIKGSLENWENPSIRARFNAERPAPAEPKTPDPAPTPSSSAVVTRGPMPSDFVEFLTEMGDYRARSTRNLREDAWLEDADLRELYALWRHDRAQSKTTT